jgi:hypothetical protein
LQGHTSVSGKKYTVKDELMSLGGWRATTLDPKVSLTYKVFEFKDRLAEATSVLNKTLNDPNELPDDKLIASYERALKMRERAFNDMSVLVEAARSSGLTGSQVKKVLKSSGVSRTDILHLLRGKIPKWAPGRAAARKSKKRAKLLHGIEQAKVISKRYRFIRREKNSRRSKFKAED